MKNHQDQRPYIPQYDRSTNEQDRFLDYCQDNESLITVYLESGLTLQGKVVNHDRKVLLLGPMRSAKEPRLIFKSYICLVRAEEYLPLFLEYKGRGTYLTRKNARRIKRKERIKQDGRLLRIPGIAAVKAEAAGPAIKVKRVSRSIALPKDGPPPRGGSDGR